MDLLIGIVASLIAAVLAWVAKRNWPKIAYIIGREKRVRVFSPPSGGKYNKAFYSFFSDVMANARQDIYITGEGFDTSTAEGSASARQLIDAHKKALHRRVRIVRLQTRLNADPGWIECLIELQKEFPDYIDISGTLTESRWRILLLSGQP
ncbi:MAG: hypothetical protein MN733_42985 [Nitrososphaera sp.]|nr:hypothetical protein [Nitrososphaera sp.]